MAKFPLSKGGGPLLADTFTHTSTHFLIKIFLVQRVQRVTCHCHTVRATRCTSPGSFHSEARQLELVYPHRFIELAPPSHLPHLVGLKCKVTLPDPASSFTHRQHLSTHAYLLHSLFLAPLIDLAYPVPSPPLPSNPF